MKYMTGNEIRKAYLQFFKSKEHLILHSFRSFRKRPQPAPHRRRHGTAQTIFHG